MNWQIKKTKTDEIIKYSNSENLKEFNFHEYLNEYFGKDVKKIIWADSTNEIQNFKNGDIIVIFEDDLEIELTIEINEKIFNRDFVNNFNSYDFKGFNLIINTESVKETKKLDEKLKLLTNFKSEILNDTVKIDPEDIGNLSIFINVNELENIVVEYLERKIKI
jgi:hypothetical protein